MVKFWARRIGYDEGRIGEVPALWRDKVMALIGEREKAGR